MSEENPSPEEPIPETTSPKQNKDLPEKQGPKIRISKGQISLETRIESGFQGPIPPPEALSEYNKVIPDGANRIMSVFESEVKHRHQLEDQELGQRTDQIKRGQNFGFSLAIIGLSYGTLISLTVSPWAGVVFAGGSLVSLVGVFVSQQRKRDRLAIPEEIEDEKEDEGKEKNQT